MNEYFFNRYRANNGVKDLAPFFNNQEPLWNKFEATGSNPLRKYGINVLTMRLLLAQDSLSALKEYELAIKQKTGQYVIPPTSQTTASGVQNVVLHPDPGSGVMGEVVTTDTIRAHEHFYSFLSSLVSSLDWLSNEINEIYSLGITRPDWGQLCKNLTAIAAQNAALASIIKAADLDPKKLRLFEYRNVIEHEGVVKIAEAVPLNGVVIIDADYAITVQDNPRDSTSPPHTRLIELSKEFFFFVVETCDKAYGAMI